MNIPLNLYIQRATKAYDSQYDSIIYLAKEEMKELEGVEGKRDYFANISVNALKQRNDGIKKIEHNLYLSLGSVLIIVISSIFILLMRYRWISCLNECINQSLEEKIALEKKQGELQSEIKARRDILLKR